MTLQGLVGPSAQSQSLGVQTDQPLRLGNMGDLIVSELHGRYYEAAYRRSLFNAANQAAQAVSVAFATAYTGLVLSNPQGSPVNLVLNKVGIALSAAPAAIAPIGLMAGFSPATAVVHTTPVTPKSRLVGLGGAPIGLVDSSATLPLAPTLFDILMGGFTAAALPAVSPSLIDIEGSLVLPPGAFAAIYALTAVTGIFSFDWEEIPL